MTKLNDKWFLLQNVLCDIAGRADGEALAALGSVLSKTASMAGRLSSAPEDISMREAQ